MLLLTFLLGFIISYIGSISPSMLNITAVKISLEKTKTAANQFAIGVSFVSLFQAFFALLFLKVILKNPVILDSLEKVAAIVFLLLSIFFFREARKEQQISASKTTKNGFISGAGLSLINLFSIPFYAGVAAVLNNNGWLNLELLSILLFSLGSTLGTYFILSHYILLADKIKPKIAQFSQYLNYVLSAITGVVALATLFKML